MEQCEENSQENDDGKDSVTFRSFSENLLIPKEVDIHKKPGSASDIL